MRTFLPVLCIIALCFGLSPVNAATQYRTRVIDVPAGMSAFNGVSDINDQGQVTFSASNSSERRAYGYVADRDGSLAQIGLLDARDSISPSRISNNGIVVGNATNYWASGVNLAAFVWTQDGGTEQLPGRTTSSWTLAEGINSSGTSVGHTTSSGGSVVACSWDSSGMMSLLPSLGGGSGVASDINESGYATGFSTLTTGEQIAAVWNPDGTMRNLGALPGYTDSRAFAINSKGQVVGYSSFGPADDQPVTLWNPDGSIIRVSPEDFGSAFSYSVDINDIGQVIGWTVDGTNHRRSFLYTPETGAVEFSMPGVTNFTPTGINNLGEICGNGYWQGKSTMLVLEPVPEPSSLVVLAAGLASVARIGRRRK